MATDESVPAQREDNIGALARQLIGDEGTGPDFTAAPPLLDALEEANYFDTAVRLRNQLADMVGLLNSGVETEPRQRVHILESLRYNLHQCLIPVLYDYTSLVTQLARFVERCTAPPAVQSGKVELETVRVPVHETCRRGMRVAIDGERSGVVVSDRGADGMADVMPLAGGDYPEGYSEGVMGMPMRSVAMTDARRLPGPAPSLPKKFRKPG